MKLREAIEEVSDDEIIKKAKNILKQKEEEEKKFSESIKKVDFSKLSKRISFRKYSPDDNIKALVFIAIGIYENVLKLKKKKYQIVLIKGETAGHGDAQVWHQKDKTIIHMKQNYLTGSNFSHYENILINLAHEMIHIKQHQEHDREWFNFDLPWAKRPHEIDALKRENQLFKQFLLKANNIYLGADVKIEKGKVYRRVRGKPTGFDFSKHFQVLKKEVPMLSIDDIMNLEYEVDWVPM